MTELPRNGSFLLKHGDKTAADVNIDLLDGAIRKVQVRDRERLPPGGNMSTDDLRLWWMRRAVPQLRGKIISNIK